jgi:glycosyltransferase involved in cell wall biosynthesis
MSRQDNQPLTVLEALVQGTSVVGYPTGGVREIDEVTKFEFGEEEKIVATLQQLARLKRTSMERNILANSSIERFGVKNFLVKHIAVYESRLKNE